jgi:hypothetical protein
MVLEIGDGASVRSTGTIIIGTFGSQKNSKIKLEPNLFSLVGSVVQEDPSFLGAFPGTTSVIEMGTGSVVEIWNIYPAVYNVSFC